MKKLLFLLFIPTLWSCNRQNDVSPAKKTDALIKGGKLQTFSGGDGAWDRLGYGIDVTREITGSNTVSDAPVFNLPKFAIDYPSRTDVTTTTQGSEELTTGATAVDYMHDYSSKSSFDISLSTPKIEGAQKNTDKDYFSESISQNYSDQNRTSYSNTYSFATYKSIVRVKRLRFTSDVTVNLLMQYLTPDFVNNVATMSADALVAKYGTHVLLDISIGGCLKFDYNGALLKETDYSKRTQQVKAGLGFGLLKVVGININSDMSSEEVTEISKATSNKHYTANFYGGTNSGTSISIDKDGYTSQTVNLAGWQQSVNANNAALIGTDKALFLYDFISDPVKKAQVKTVIVKHIADSQIKTINTVPFYRMFNPNTGRHFYTSGSGEVQTLIGLGFQVESSLGGLLTSQLSGSVPLYRYFKKQSNLDDHFYTTASSVSGYTSEGRVGYVYANPSQTHLAIPIYQYFYTNWEHMFTTNYDELGLSHSGYNYQGIGFYLL